MPNLCVIVPCYNEAGRLNTDAFSSFLSSGSTCFCFVNDGSSDNTLSILEKIHKAHQDKVLIINQPANQGKAEAVRTGVLESASWKQFDLLAYFDADLAVPLEEILHLQNYVVGHEEFDLFMGTRLKRLGASINRRPVRHIFGRIFATFVSNLFSLPAYDTQCGFKMFRAKIVPHVFKQTFHSKWFFDIEILLRIKSEINNGSSYEGVCEVPLNKWDEIDGSKLKLIDFISVPIELLRLKRKYKIKS